MNRNDALDLLREISADLSENEEIKGCSIDGFEDDVDLKIIFPADQFQYSLRIILPILSKHGYLPIKLTSSIVIFDFGKNQTETLKKKKIEQMVAKVQNLTIGQITEDHQLTLAALQNNSNRVQCSGQTIGHGNGC